MAENRLSGKLAVILHADVADSTALVQQDEQLVHQRIQDTFHRISETIEKYQGRILELRGDALLAEFECPSDAAAATLAFLKGWAHYKLEKRADLAHGIPDFEEAIRLDPSHARAHAALASVYWDAYVNDWAFDLGIPTFKPEELAN